MLLSPAHRRKLSVILRHFLNLLPTLMTNELYVYLQTKKLLFVNIRAILLKFILQNMTIMNRGISHEGSLRNLSRLNNNGSLLWLEKNVKFRKWKVYGIFYTVSLKCNFYRLGFTNFNNINLIRNFIEGSFGILNVRSMK